MIYYLLYFFQRNKRCGLPEHKKKGAYPNLVILYVPVILSGTRDLPREFCGGAVELVETLPRAPKHLFLRSFTHPSGYLSPRVCQWCVACQSCTHCQKNTLRVAPCRSLLIFILSPHLFFHSLLLILRISHALYRPSLSLWLESCARLFCLCGMTLLSGVILRVVETKWGLLCSAGARTRQRRFTNIGIVAWWDRSSQSPLFLYFFTK